MDNICTFPTATFAHVTNETRDPVTSIICPNQLIDVGDIVDIITNSNQD